MLNIFIRHSSESWNPACERLRANSFLLRRLPRQLDPVSNPRANALEHGMTKMEAAYA